MHPLFILYTSPISNGNIFFKNMGSFCYFKTFTLCSPYLFSTPTTLLINCNINEKYGPILLPITFTLCIPYLIYTPLTSLFVRFSCKTWPNLLPMFFTLCSTNIFFLNTMEKNEKFLDVFNYYNVTNGKKKF